MCNTNCYRWASRHLVDEDIRGKKVIEVGAYDVNGSLRYQVELLKPAAYVGTDISSGPGVDVVCPAEKTVGHFGRESFDAVVSTCVLEHTQEWQAVVSNIKNLCKPGGVILLIVPSDWPYHGFPYDFWRYQKADIQEIFSDCRIETLEEDKRRPSLVYAKIRKPQDFTEKDLSSYALYSIVTGNRIKTTDRRIFERWSFKLQAMKNQLTGILAFIKYRFIDKSL